MCRKVAYELNQNRNLTSNSFDGKVAFAKTTSFCNVRKIRTKIVVAEMSYLISIALLRFAINKRSVVFVK